MAQLVKTMAGLAIASVKTVNGLAIASAKTIAGLDNTSAGATLKYESTGTTTDWMVFTFYTYLAQRFTTDGSGWTTTRVDIELEKVGTIAAGTLTIEIWSESGGNPSAIVGTGSGTVDRTAIANGWVSFTGMSATLSASTNYYVVVRASSTDTNTSNCIRWYCGGSTALARRGSTNGSSWDNQGDNNQHVRIYGT